ncbi:hypothetical protein C440_02753 [Haloferax mucosum ATCC BAA-1512]|uniref:DICT domain-containing protein n=1 Tax=Haloferax mucosum ATCC BAA-1512 TaxID=662479 RepID=M0IQ23_9EURY|nr:DICT sensory domain-containing protein [Haloferax mucosum]ELZ98132.1 hypothetical protein C440_02753 [Haloferax mucosum ATCC BAA-1512]
MTLERFIGRVDAPKRVLSVVNRSEPAPVQRMLETTFDEQPVTVDELDLPDEERDTVILSEVADGETRVLATSPLAELMDAILLVNSDIYITGQSDLAAYELPEVLTRLDDVPFSLRGYPESNKEKLLLIAISRFIERRAWDVGAGRLRTSFQRLSRIDDERGTREVYEQIAATDVQTHIYGVPDWHPSPEFGVLSHGGHTPDYRNSWFVVYTPPEDAAETVHESATPVALLAFETEPRRWKGYWTFQSALVADINRYIERNM